MKLKTGSGEQVLVILTQLASKALKKKNFSFKKPKYEEVGQYWLFYLEQAELRQSHRPKGRRTKR